MAYEVIAQDRKEQGTSASRRLRRTGRVPAVIYGGDQPAVAIDLDHNDTYHALKQEAFHRETLNLQLNGNTVPVVIADVQWHPYKPQVLHIDFKRV